MRNTLCLLPLLGSLLLAGNLPAAQSILQPLPNFGTNGDGTIRPGDFGYTFITGDGNRLQRGLAYNPATGHLIIVNRNPLGAETINVIDALTGAEVGQLNQDAKTLGGNTDFPYNMVAVADDGAIYVGNLTTSGTLVEYILYRWADESATQIRVYGPANPGNTTAGNSRWGDTLAARGSGMNTEVLITGRGTLAAILKPADAALTTFTNAVLTSDAPSGALAYAVAFGSGNTFYAKEASSEGNPLYHMSYDAGAGTATRLQVYTTDQFPGRVGALMVQPASNLLACIEMTAGTNQDLVRLYDISDPANPPVFLDRKIVDAWTNANSIFAGEVAFGGGNVYALDSDNGLAGYSISQGTIALAPLIFTQPSSKTAQITSNVVFTVGVDGTSPLAYQWQLNSNNISGQTNASLLLANLTTGNGGYYSVVVTNNYGAVTSAVALLTVLPNYGNLLIYEPFAYPVGTMLPGQGDWSMTSAAANGAIEAGNLDVAGLRNSYGFRYTWTNTSSVRKAFGQYTAGEVYASFAFRLDTASTSTSSETMAGFSYGTSTVFPLKINIIGNGSGGYQLGLYKGGGTVAGAVDTTHTFQAGETVFVVVRYKFGASVPLDDTLDLWVNPDPLTFGLSSPPPSTLGPLGAGSMGSGSTVWSYIDRFFWRWASAGYTKRVADELRVGFSWAEVTPPVDPYLFIRLSGPNAILSWPTNQVGYSLESIGVFNDPDGWQPVAAPVVVQDGNNTATVPVGGQYRFFRLRK